ncbi:MAG: hypothetical protein OHK0022_30440 [Roseiflexaceae bacterium]
MPRSTPQVIEIPPERLDEATSLLARAFAHDPLMLHLFDGGPGYRTRLAGFLRYTCEVQFAMGWPLLGLVPRTRLAAVATLTPPEPAPWPDTLTKRYNTLAARLSPEQCERLEHYATLPGAQQPDTPLFYAGMIGVRPESQGLGYARRLLDEVHRRAAAHPTATGVGLDTENQANVALYQHLGYRVVGRVPFGGLTIWCLFRPNEQAAERGA